MYLFEELVPSGMCSGPAISTAEITPGGSSRFFTTPLGETGSPDVMGRLARHPGEIAWPSVQPADYGSIDSTPPSISSSLSSKGSEVACGHDQRISLESPVMGIGAEAKAEFAIVPLQ